MWCLGGWGSRRGNTQGICIGGGVRWVVGRGWLQTGERQQVYLSAVRCLCCSEVMGQTRDIADSVLPGASRPAGRAGDMGLLPTYMYFQGRMEGRGVSSPRGDWRERREKCLGESFAGSSKAGLEGTGAASPPTFF